VPPLFSVLLPLHSALLPSAFPRATSLQRAPNSVCGKIKAPPPLRGGGVFFLKKKKSVD